MIKVGDRHTIVRTLGTFTLTVEQVTEQRVIFKFDHDQGLRRPYVMGFKRFAKMITS